ncbi:MAG: sortase [Ilumatobacteraceae bacterium]|nr:sortase [Ilumatobacteraceae bacterium]
MTEQFSADGSKNGDAPADAASVPEPGGRFRRGPRERVSRWDRPPEPHDWRFYVGTAGKVLIVTGLLMFGFVAYQLWGTGIETARAQQRLEDRFSSILAERTDDSAPTSTAVPVTTPPTTGAAAVTVTTDAPDIVAGATTTTVPVDLSDDVVDQEPIPQPIRGEPLLRLEIPAIGRDDIVVPGVAVDDLKDGPGHYPDTPLPGQLGNAAIAGHRTTYGAPFFDVDQLEAGDEIITTLLNGDRFVYEVTSTEVVSASDYWVVTTRDPDIAELTLTSCHPKYTARQRIVVHSVLNPEKSSNVGLPTFYTLDDEDDAEQLPGDDPVISADIEITEPDSALGTLDDTTDSTDTTDTTDGPADQTGDQTPDQSDEQTRDASDEDAVVDTDDDDPRAVTDDELADATAATADPVDAFSRGWFDDRGAFLQIALWGAALTIISLLAHQLAKRYRRSSIGFVAGVVPFVVALYFFYQNVNRLLPPGI